MTINYVEGDIFESKAMAIVNPVNCVGAMGKGLALRFKRLYPTMFKRYQQLCVDGKIRPGVLYYSEQHNYTIVNFPTKDDWRNPSELDYIERGLRNFRANYKKRGITSVAFPPLGCGLGGLRWTDVRQLMERYLGDLDIDVYIYKP